MLKRGLLAAIIATAFLLPTAAAAGRQQCPHAREIIDLSKLVLDDLGSSGPTLSKRYGTDAAYLTLHYGNPAEPEADRILHSLLAGDVAAGRSFVQAYLISRYGYDAAMKRLRAMGESSAPVDITVMRQLAKTNRFDIAIDAISANDAPPDTNLPYADVLAVIDFPDAEKRKFAQAAEAAGLYAVAGGIYASMGDRSDWPGYVKRNFKKPGFPRLRYTFLVYSAYHPELPPMPDPRNTRNGLMLRKYVRTMAAAGFRLPQTSLPLLYGGANRFEPLFPAKASQALIKLADQGAVKATDTMDESWLIAFREIIAQSGDARATMEKMERVRFSGRRHLMTSAGDILNWMLAVEAIVPWLDNPDGKFPDVPMNAGESLGVNWPTWRAVATGVKSKDLTNIHSLPGRAPAMAAELLFAQGDYRALADLIISLPSPRPGLPLAADFAVRLDRLCDSRLYFPGEGLLRPGALFYDFDQATR